MGPGDTVQPPPCTGQGSEPSVRLGGLTETPPYLAVAPQGCGEGRGGSKGGFYELAQGEWPGTPERWRGASSTLLHLLGDLLACQEITQQLNTLYAELVY